MQTKKLGIGLSNLKQRIELLCKGSLIVSDLETPTFEIYVGKCYENTNS